MSETRRPPLAYLRRIYVQCDTVGVFLRYGLVLVPYLEHWVHHPTLAQHRRACSVLACSVHTCTYTRMSLKSHRKQECHPSVGVTAMRLWRNPHMRMPTRLAHISEPQAHQERLECKEWSALPLNCHSY